MPIQHPGYHKLALSGDLAIDYAYTTKPVATVVFLGVGQSGANFLTVAQSVPDNVATIAAFPYHRFAQSNMEQLGIMAVSGMFDAIDANIPHVIAESQAAPAVVEAICQDPSKVRSLTLLEPLGFNRTALGNSPASRYDELMRRSRTFWKHPDQSLKISGNRTTALELVRNSIPAIKRLKADYTVGANSDVTHQAAWLAEQLPVRIYAGEYDSLFPYSEIESAVYQSRIEVICIPDGTHLNQATPKGLDELRRVIAALPDSI